MAGVASVRVEDHSEEVTEEMKRKVELWLAAIGEDAAATATSIPNFPVDTGRMKNSVNWATEHLEGSSGDAPNSRPEEKSVYIGTNVEYAPYHEFGTSRGIPARHFIQYGMTAHQGEYKQLLEDALKEE